jgi:hypothetical protein
MDGKWTPLSTHTDKVHNFRSITEATSVTPCQHSAIDNGPTVHLDRIEICPLR